MWVITEAYSIFIKNSTLNHLYPWWVLWYKANIPNTTFCSDWFLTRIWFMSPEDNASWLNHLSEYNIIYLDENEESKDICIHAQGIWLLSNCDRLEFTKNDNIYAGTEVAWLKWSYDKYTIENISIPENRSPEMMHRIPNEEMEDLEVFKTEDWLEYIIKDWKKRYIWKAFKNKDWKSAWLNIDDEIVKREQINSEEQFKAKMILSDEWVSKGLSKYNNIMELFNSTNVSKDKDFQKKFNYFYKIARRPAEFYKAYYTLLEKSKNTPLSFEWILMFFYWKFWKCEKSFASKLLHTINPEMPIRDKFILKNLGLKDSWSDIEKSIKLYEQIKITMEKKISSEEWRMIIQIFDKIYPDTNITDMKKYDFYLWQLR